MPCLSSACWRGFTSVPVSNLTAGLVAAITVNIFYINIYIYTCIYDSYSQQAINSQQKQGHISPAFPFLSHNPYTNSCPPPTYRGLYVPTQWQVTTSQKTSFLSSVLRSLTSISLRKPLTNCFLFPSLFLPSPNYGALQSQNVSIQIALEWAFGIFFEHLYPHKSYKCPFV